MNFARLRPAPLCLALWIGLGASGAGAATPPYVWKNVRIDGGGFVSGIVFSPAEKNLIYARTDIGGLYRWEEAGRRWLPLLDWVGQDNWGWNGVVSVATDPADPRRVYAAVGMYTNGWDPNNGAILRSADQGRTWSATVLPFKLGGNMPGRGMGERLAVDPNRNSVLYFGAPSGKGLWRSVDAGVTWTPVASFPNPGNYAQDPNDPNGYLNDNQGVVWVTFDKASGSRGAASRTIYVGVADKQNTVYRSRDAGATWERVPGQPVGYIAHKGVHDPVNGVLYIATSDTGGPYDGGKGDVWKLETASGSWTRISPVPSTSADNFFGYSGLTIDRQNPKVLMVGTQVAWWPDTVFFRSTDGGASWSRIWEYAGYPARNLRYTMDISEVPWLSFGQNPQPPEATPKLGWMNEAVEIDPFNANRFLYGTGATLYGSENLQSWDRGERITIKPMVKGLEETAVLDLLSPPQGAPLLSALGDIGGFRHDDLGKVPALMYQSPFLVSTTSMDYAELKPQVVVRVGNAERQHLGVSTDGGTSWYAGQEPAGTKSGGMVAVSADANAIVWSTEGAGVQRSTTYGASWAPSQGLPAGAQVRSDRGNPRRFYAWAGGRFYVSHDAGASFTATPAALPQGGRVRFKATPGREGELWLAHDGTGLWRSTDGGTSFKRLGSVEQASNMGFGKAAPGRNEPALYAIAKVQGVRGVFRSDDSGTSWTRLNDEQHQWGNIGDALTGDPRVYGRVYVGTNGRGIVYGEPGAASGGGGTPPGEGGGNVTASLKVDNEWGGGYCASVTLTNPAATPVVWQASVTVRGKVNNLWNAQWSQAGSTLQLSGVGWNSTLAPKASQVVGFCADK